MTKRDYVKIANALRQADLSSPNLAVKSGVYLAFSYLVEVLKSDNYRFSKEKFFKAVYDK